MQDLDLAVREAGELGPSRSGVRDEELQIERLAAEVVAALREAVAEG